MRKIYTWAQRGYRRGSLITLMAVFLVSTSQVRGAEANPFVTWVNGEPSESQITALPPSPVQPKLSFQTRISQATLPILEGVFYEVIVHYKDLLSTGDCEEHFEQVRVLDSVLNLELGLNARCDFARAVAQRSELEMELCLVSLMASHLEQSLESNWAQMILLQRTEELIACCLGHFSFFPQIPYIHSELFSMYQFFLGSRQLLVCLLHRLM